MEISYLRVFFDVARAGKFSDAAKKNNISVSALSRSVRLLEEAEGVKLLDRSKDGARLTAKGQEIFRLCQKLFEVEKEIENVCRGTQEKCQGILSFSVSDNLISHLIHAPLTGFCAKYPEIMPRIYSGSPDEIAQSLLSAGSEFALMLSKVNSPQLEFHLIRREAMALVVSPALWSACRSLSNHKTLENVLKTRGYISSINAQLHRRFAQTMVEVFGKIPPIGLEVNSQEQQKQFCLSGMGVAYLARFMVKNEIEEGRLFEVPVEFLRELDLWLVRDKGRFLSYNSRTFLKVLFPDLSLE